MSISVHPRGTVFTRLVMALAQAKEGATEAAEIAQARFADSPEVGFILRAAVAAGGTGNDMAALAPYRTAVREFIELARPATIIGRIAGLRRIPFRTRVPRATSGVAAYWTGEAKPKPLSALSVNPVVAPATKIAGIVALSDELVRFSSPSAEALVRAELLAAVTAFTDRQFIDETVAEVTDISPASILNGAPSFASAGNDADAVVADVGQCFDSVYGAFDPVAPVLIVSTATAYRLAAMRTTTGAAAFPEMTVRGGTIAGIPVIASAHVRNESGGSTLALIEASRVLLADEGDMSLDTSRQVTLQFDSVPVDGAQQGVSLWQNGLTAVRAERSIHWQRADEAAAAYVAEVGY